MFRFIIALFASIALSANCFAQNIIVVPSGQHAHRMSDGRILVHGNQNYGNASAHAGIALPWVQMAEAGQRIRVGRPSTAQIQPYVFRTPYQNYSNGSFNYWYSYQNQAPSQSGCPGGKCPTNSRPSFLLR